MIETPRLRLRRHRVEDLDRYLPLWSAPHDPANPASFQLNEEDAWSRLLRFVGHWGHFGYGLFIAEDRRTGDIVGEVGFAQFHRRIDPRLEGVPEAAWRILESRRGVGFASEAMRAAADWLDASGLAARSVCIIDPNNAASLKVAAGLGFREFDRRLYKGRQIILLERKGM